MPGYACRIASENFQAIASEKPDFNLEEIEAWLDTHGGGFFVRDPEHIFDNHYLHPDVFFEIYVFAENDPHSLFRRIARL